MTKKDFVLISDILRGINLSVQVDLTAAQYEQLVRRFAVALQNKSGNPRFDSAKFFEACMRGVQFKELEDN